MAAPYTIQESDSDSESIHHLVVLIHGLWGTPVHLQHLRETLQKQYPQSKTGVHVFVPKSNANYHTYDGIEVGGERITHEIEDTIHNFEAEGHTITKISLAGYSLGGIVARYVIGLLYKNGVFSHVQPVNYTSFATPHLGVRTPSPGYFPQIFNFLGSRTVGTSGQQMFLTDNFRNTGRCLLDIMADPESIFYKGLQMFQRKSLYANTTNDRSVPFYTASISRSDPFVDIDAVDVHYVEGQDVVLDPAHPVSLRKAPAEEPVMTLAERWIPTERTRKAAAFYSVFFTVLPLAIPVFLVNAGYQTYRSAQRVRLHESGSTFDLKRYRIPLLEETQAVQDKVMERFATEKTNLGGQDYLPTPPPEPASSASSTKSLGSDAGQDRNNSPEMPGEKLALTDVQSRMVDNLDKVGFTKYPAHIIKVRHTHAAIVVRTPSPAYDEGRAVIAHWAQNFKV